MFEDINGSMLRDYAPDLEQRRLDEWYSNNKFSRTPLSQTPSNRSTARERLSGGFQPSTANFPSTSGMSLKEVQANESIQNSAALAINRTMNDRFGGNTWGSKGTLDLKSNFIDPRGLDFQGNASLSDSIANNYNTTLKNSGIGNEFKVGLTSSQIKDRVANYSSSTAAVNNVDHLTKRRQELQRANENRIRKGSNQFNKTLLKERGKDFVKNNALNPMTYLGKKITETAKTMPNPKYDSLTALAHGVSLEETKGSMFDRYARKLTDLTNKDIDPAIKADVEDSLKSYKGINRISGDPMNISGLGTMSSNEIEYWKQIQREETTKSVRPKGGYADPFDNVVRTQDGLIENRFTSAEGLNQTKSNYLSNKAEISDIDRQLASLEESSLRSNRYSSFFDASENGLKNRVEFENLTNRKNELNERIRRYDLGYTGEYINNDFTGPVRQGERIPNRHYNEPATVKESHRPTYGTSGFGLGFKNSMAASGGEHLARFGHYMNPFGAGGASFSQSLMESAGIMNKSQRMQAAQARGFSKLMHYAVPATALGFIASDMHEGKDGMEILGEVASMGTALHGWRVGTSLGGAIGSMGGGVGKFLGLGVGGVVGAASGLLLGEAVVGGISDAMSQDSEIRKFSKKMSSREMFVSTPDSRQSLTARGASLQKLAKSGLNDRGLLLGNEATILKG